MGGVSLRGARALTLRCLPCSILAALLLLNDSHAGFLSLLKEKQQEEEKGLSWPVCHSGTFPPVTSEARVPSLCKLKNATPKRFAVVDAANSQQDIEWMDSLGGDIELYHYQSHHSNRPHYFPPGGNEAGAYLQYIIDYYDCLPEAVAFIHGHDNSWHSCSMSETLKALDWAAIPGYAGLNRRAELTWVFDTRAKTNTHIEIPPPTATGKEAYNGDFEALEIEQGSAFDWRYMQFRFQAEYNIKAYDHFFGPAGLGEMPAMIHWMCCSQFAVTREAIQLRSRDFYIQALHFVRYNEVLDTDFVPKSYVVGDIFTYHWQMIFGKASDYRQEEHIAEDVLFSGASNTSCDVSRNTIRFNLAAVMPKSKMHHTDAGQN